MQNRIPFLLGCVAGGMLATMPLSASSIIIDSTSNITIDYNGFYSSSQILIPGLTASVNLSNFTFSPVTIDNQTATQVQFDYVISNTSTNPITGSRLANFAISTTPDILATNLNTVSGAFNTVQLNATQPNGVGTVEICFTAQSCPGGGSDGIAVGQSGSGSATLNFLGSIHSFAVDHSFVRYQAITCTDGATCNPSASGIPSAPSDDSVPEPSTYALISSGLIGVWYMGKRRRTA